MPETPPAERKLGSSVELDPAADDPTAGDPRAGDSPPSKGRPSAIDRSLPADPAAYDAARASLARARGLSAPYIAGGRDPEPDSGRREERFYLRLLVLMVVGIVLMGFVLGILANLVGLSFLAGG